MNKQVDVAYKTFFKFNRDESGIALQTIPSDLGSQMRTLITTNLWRTLRRSIVLDVNNEIETLLSVKD